MLHANTSRPGRPWLSAVCAASTACFALTACARYDAEGGYLAALLLTGSGGGSGLLAPSDPEAPADGLSAWTRRRFITFDNATQTENLDDFPVLIKLNAARIDYNTVQDAGQDVRFLDSDLSGPLAHEIELWNEAGDSFVWVRVPRIDALSNADGIWMYYGNPGAPDGQAAANVWNAGYRAVYHLNGGLQDSTANALHGANFGTTDAAGRIGRGRNFDGATQYFTAPSTGYSFTQGAIEAWARAEGAAPLAGEGRYIFSHVNMATATNTRLYLLRRNPSNDFWVGLGNAFSAPSGDSGADFPINAWQHATLLWDNGAANAFWNGAQQQTYAYNPAGFVANGLDASITIGKFHLNAAEYWSGQIDEVRISTVARSDDWLWASHRSMTDVFAAFGAEENLP